MLSYFTKAKTQKKLYFQLETEFKKINEDERTIGIYAIFKNDVCMYVGQSKNIPSRIATHLSGKYKECSKVLIFPTIDIDDDLIPLEKFTMKHLKPIENLMVDFTEEISRDSLAEGEILYGLERSEFYKKDFNIVDCADITLINSKYNLLVSCEFNLDLQSDIKTANYIIDEINKLRQHPTEEQ